MVVLPSERGERTEGDLLVSCWIVSFHPLSSQPRAETPDTGYPLTREKRFNGGAVGAQRVNIDSS